MWKFSFWSNEVTGNFIVNVMYIYFIYSLSLKKIIGHIYTDDNFLFLYFLERDFLRVLF